MEHQVVKQPEFEMTLPLFKEDYESVCRELTLLSVKMRDLLPDPSIGPEERLERIARIVPHSLLQSQNMKTARTKLNYLKRRLDDLVPGTQACAEEKLDLLIKRIHEKVPGSQTLFEKLEALGDHRVSDIGR